MTAGLILLVLALHGTVTDATGRPLPGATITVKDTDRFAVTDEAGEFDLDAAPGARLIVALPGFATREVTVSNASPLVPLIVVLQVAAAGATVVVRAPAAPPSVESRMTLTPLDVVRTPGAQGDLMRALETMPGVSRIDEGAGLFVRGGDVSEVLVLLDGVVVSHPYRYETPTGGFRGAVDPFLTQGASFTTGGFGAQYGNAMSAVVDLTGLDRPRVKRLTATAGFAGVSLGGALPAGEHGGFRIAVNRTTPSLLFAVNPSPRAYDLLPGGWDASGAAYVDSASAGSFRVTAIAQRDHVGVELEKDSFVGFLHSGTRHTLIAGRWERALGRNWRAAAAVGSDVYDNLTDIGVLDVDERDTHHSGRIAIAGQRSRWSLRAGADGDVSHAGVTGSVPARGGDFGGVAGRSGFDVRVRDRRTGAYADTSWTAGRFVPELGVRVDGFQRAGRTTVDPRAGLRVDLSARQHLRFAWGEYHQAPAARYYDAERGAAALDVMSATHYVAGYEAGSLAGRTFLRLEAYAKRYRALPVQSETAGYDSTGYGSAAGADVFARGTWKRISLRGNVSLLHAERRWTSFDQRDRFPLPGGTWTPDFAIPFSWQIVAGVPLPRGWSAGAAWRTAAGRPFTPAAGSIATANGYEPVWGAINSERMPRYERLDLSLSWVRVTRGRMITFFTSLDNALGRSNVFEYAYSSDYTTRRPVVTAHPRSLYVGCSFSTQGDRP